MAPERERHTPRQIKEGRAVEQAGDRMAREADHMEQTSNKLGSEIEQVRSDWQRKRADDNVPGATPPDNKEEASGTREAEAEAAEQDEDRSSDADEDDENPSV